MAEPTALETKEQGPLYLRVTDTATKALSWFG
jgi:hypothetical protein